MMAASVAVLSDIHGVLPALDAVLAEPAVRAAERIVLTGDIAAGDIPDPIAPWAARQLSPGHVDWLARLPYPVTLAVDGFGDVVFCHATPRDDEEVVVVDSRLDRWAEVLAGLPEQIMTVVCGHTHMPFTRLAHRRQIINPGSVGMPYGRPGAHWALLADGAVTMRRTGYDIEAACATIQEMSDYPDVAEWADYFLHSRASDADALGAFAPRDGRALWPGTCPGRTPDDGCPSKRVRPSHVQLHRFAGQLLSSSSASSRSTSAGYVTARCTALPVSSSSSARSRSNSAPPWPNATPGRAVWISTRTVPWSPLTPIVAIPAVRGIRWYIASAISSIRRS
jgi:predicted phosphodiesterase